LIATESVLTLHGTAGRPNSGMYSVFPDDYRVPFQKRRLLGIPEEVFKYYQSAYCAVTAGVPL
jgi:nuclear pore complex protein Nup155